MLTEFLRDQLFATAWFGLMTMVWFGWAQEAAPKAWRGWLGAGSVLGVLLFGFFLFLTIRNWDTPSALDGRYELFGLLTVIEVVAAGVGAIVFWRRGASRWMAWWVAVIVALHFIPLGLMLMNDVSIAIVGVIEFVILLALIPKLKREEGPTSRLVGPVMGGTFLLFSIVSAILVLTRNGVPL